MPCVLSHLPRSASSPQRTTSVSSLGISAVIGHVELDVATGRGRAFLESRQEPVLARGPVDRHVFRKHRNRKGGSGLPFGSGMLIVIVRSKTLSVARTDHLQTDGILARREHVFVGQHGFEPRLAAAIDLNRLDEQAPAQRCKGVEHRVDHARLQLAERGREPLAGHDRVLGRSDCSR